MSKIGIVAGSFDIIHPGYIRLFKDAKKVCDYLIVALQEDPAVERPKEKFHPIFTREERLEILMSIKYVDEVRYYETENDLVMLFLDIKPDIRIIGNDYVNKRITGKGMVPLYFHTRETGWSVTRVRKLIQEEKR
jgi:glycerol-3-phosphate cytidylyltransferase